MLLAVDPTTTVATVTIVGVLATAFGYALSLLVKGTDRLDRITTDQVEAAEQDRDWWRTEAEHRTTTCRDEAERQAAACAERVRTIEHDRDHWRERYLSTFDPPAPPHAT